jgi:hypothetical protein
MKVTYFDRLKNHPGIPVATMLTFAFILAGFANKNPVFGIALGLVASIFVWITVLITARTQPVQKKSDD